MPWLWLDNLTPADTLAVAPCLRTLTAVHDDVSPPLHFGDVETIASIFWYVVLREARRCRLSPPRPSPMAARFRAISASVPDAGPNCRSANPNARRTCRMIAGIECS
jgi:hypothetical protein